MMYHMNKQKLQQLKSIFKLYPEVKLVYFFGSKANNTSGPLSDYDFGIYLDENDTKNIFNIKSHLFDQISHKLKTDKVDLVILNTTDSPELKYNIIKEGKLIFEQEPFKVIVEPRILNEYFDFHTLLLKHNLTKN